MEDDKFSSDALRKAWREVVLAQGDLEWNAEAESFFEENNLPKWRADFEARFAREFGATERTKPHTTED